MREGVRKREAEAGETKGGARGEGNINTWMQSVGPGQRGAPEDLQNNWISNVELWCEICGKCAGVIFCLGPFGKCVWRYP